jgi:tripartite-type tricarboxylate transporter receptor subunit TctC
MKKLLFATCALACTTALGQDFPTRAVKLLVPNAPGSSIDTMSRIVAAKLGDALGQPVFVENRDGAGGLIGVEAGKNARPDGYTLICASNGSRRSSRRPRLTTRSPISPRSAASPSRPTC